MTELDSSAATIVRARWLFDDHHGVIENHGVRIEADRIMAVDRPDRLGAGTHLDLGDVVLAPGLVNAHTHLELSFLHEQIFPSSDFVGWTRTLIGLLAERESEEAAVRESVLEGLATCLACGVTLIGDISRRPDRIRCWLREATARPAVVSFGEFIGLSLPDDNARSRMAAILEAPHDAEEDASDLAIGISPHAAHTVHPEALAEIGDLAQRNEAPLTIHASETEAEIDYLLTGGGPFRDMFADLGVLPAGDQPVGMRPIDLLERTGLLAPSTLIAHANYLTDEDVARLAGSGANVAYCPRTHAAFGHRTHPLMRLLDAGINVCLGTDSLASNPGLELQGELRRVHEAFPGISIDGILRMATRNGATALGYADRGVLAPGKRADLTAFRIPPGCGQEMDAVLLGDVLPVMIGGRQVAP